MTSNLFFDTDCISAFLWINDTSIVEKLYKGRIIIPKPVYNELSNPVIPHLKNRIDVLINNKSAEIVDIEYGTEEYDLYYTMTNGKNVEKIIGKGEAASIALAKVNDGILASNNYRDVSLYIEKYNLKHIDTAMILKEAVDKKIITLDEGEIMWAEMLNRKRMLPTNSFKEYLNNIC